MIPELGDFAIERSECLKPAWLHWQKGGGKEDVWRLAGIPLETEELVSGSPAGHPVFSFLVRDPQATEQQVAPCLVP